METKSVKRQRITVYLDPEVIRRLKRERGDTDKPMGVVIEEALASQARKSRALPAR